MKLNDKLYDFLKWVAMIALDAFGVAYKGLAECWGWGFGNEIMTTCSILSVLVGTLIGVSAISYHKAEAVAAKNAVKESLVEPATDPDGYLEEFVENAPETDDTGNVDGGEI